MHHDWILGANDPDLMGWITTVAYLAVAMLCFTNARRVSGTANDAAGRRAFWRMASVLLVVLGINKQFDLQTPFIHAARWVALAGGWYPLRRAAEWSFVAALAVGGLTVAIWSAWRVRRDGVTYWPVCAGMVLLLVYVAVRASPLQHVPSVAGLDVSRIEGKRHIPELGAIACVGTTAAVQYLTRTRNRSQLKG